MSKFNVPMINELRITGTVVNNPRVDKTKGNNSKVVNFRIANTRKFRTRDGSLKSETTYASVTAWTKLAEICEINLEKGDKVYIKGSLQSKQLADNKMSVLEILAEKIQILTPKKIFVDYKDIDEVEEIFDDNSTEDLE